MSNVSLKLIDRIGQICTEKLIPFYTIFELTYRCNLRCRHCYILEDNKDELSLQEIESILDQLVKMGSLVITFTGGEILVRPDFFDIAKAAKARGFLLILMTNATLINDENIHEIVSLKPLGVEISLYGSSAETHDFMTKTPGSFELTIKAIKALVDRGILVVTKTVLLNINSGERKEIEALSISLGARSIIKAGIVPRKDGVLLPIRHSISFDDVRAYFVEINEKKASNERGLEPLKKLNCKAGRTILSISPSGELSPCVLMPLKLGNVRNQSISEIWYQKDNEILNKLREPTTYRSSPCFKCHLLPFCNRCPGVAYMETGDPFDLSHSACQYAKWREEISKGGEIN